MIALNSAWNLQGNFESWWLKTTFCWATGTSFRLPLLDAVTVLGRGGKSPQKGTDTSQMLLSLYAWDHSVNSPDTLAHKGMLIQWGTRMFLQYFWRRSLSCYVCFDWDVPKMWGFLSFCCCSWLGSLPGLLLSLRWDLCLGSAGTAAL